MDDHYSTASEPATPEYVFAVLQDNCRQEGYPDSVLSFDMAIADCRFLYDFDDWIDLADYLNQFWGISCTDAEWREVLDPEDQRRLGDVCRFIASRVVRQRIRPARLFGSTCAPAGAFLTIRSLLHDAGVPVEDIAPSTPLAPYTRELSGVYLGPISRLAPMVLPRVRIWPPITTIMIYGFLLTPLCFAICACMGMHLPTLVFACLVIMALCCGLIWINERYFLPLSVRFGELQTFRDLAVVVAAGNLGMSGVETHPS